VKGSYVTSVIGQNNRSSGFHRVVERQSDPIGRKERRGGRLCVRVSEQAVCFLLRTGRGIEEARRKGGRIKE
jgi:hypothetical protein